MDNATYHAHPAVSKSHLDLVARSPLHYWARYLDPNREVPEPTAAMALGSALHTHVLELDQWDARYLIAPADAPKRPTAVQRNAAKPSATTLDAIKFWDVFEQEAASKTVLSASDAEQIMAMGRAIWGHPAAAALLHWQGKAETTHMWVDHATGQACKCRPDWLTDDHRLIVDLKTTEDASPAGFRKSIANFRYHVQASWYLDGIEQATGTRPDQFLFICVEKKPPYAVAVYAASPVMVTIGAETAARDLDVLVTCKQANAWPGYSDQIEPISLPPWMMPRPDGQDMQSTPDIEMY